MTQAASLLKGTAATGCSLKTQMEDVPRDLHQKLQNDLALCYEAEVNLDSRRYGTEDCPGLNRKVTEACLSQFSLNHTSFAAGLELCSWQDYA